MKRFILSLCVTMFSLLAVSSSPKTATPAPPDFAYPKQVSTQAEKDLKNAIRSNDGKSVLSAAIRLGLAASAISRDNLPPVIKRIEKIASTEDDVVTRSLLYALLSKIYSQLYLYDRHTYDERHLPITPPYPDDIFAWSGEQFQTKIKELTVEALKGESALQKARLENYTPVVTADAITLRFYPTLYDFVANEAITTYTTLNDRHHFGLGAKWAASAVDFETLPTTHLPAQAAEVIELYQKLTRLHAGENAPMIMTDRNRLSWVTNYIPLRSNGDTNNSLTSLWIDAYHRHADSDYAGLLLDKAAETMEGINDERLFVKTATAYLASHPAAFNSKRLKYLIDNATSPSLNVQSPQITCPGYPTPIRLTGKNAKECVINVYSVGNDVDRYYQWDTRKRTNSLRINSIKINFKDSAPCVIDTVVYITLPRYGNYALVPEVDGNNPGNILINTIGCTDLALTALSVKNLSEALVVNPVSGAPVERAEIKWRKQFREPLKTAGHTNHEGVLILPTGNESMEVYAFKDNDRYSRDTNIWRNYIPESRLSAEVVTALPLYHPGDTVEMAAVVYNCRPDGNTPAVGTSVKLSFRDANYIEIDSVRTTTDSWGRIQHRFAIPQSGLTGQFSILLSAKNDFVIGRGSVTVSDYKLPTFEVTADKVKTLPDKKDVDVTGSTISYSGFPLADTEVRLALSNTSPWRWYGFTDSQPSFYTATVKTDASGRFKFAIPQEVLDNAPCPDYPFQAMITAVSPSGESRGTTVTFVNNKIYMINAEIPNIIDATIPVKVRADIIASDDTKTDYGVTATILSDNGEEIARRPLSAKGGEWSFDGYKSGRYNIRFTATDTTINCRPDVRSIIIYRTTDTISPVESPLWTPANSFTATASERRAEVLYEAASDSLHVYYIAIGIDGVAAKGWLKPHKGMNKLNITVPAGENQLKLKLMTVSGLERDEKTLTIHTPESLRSLKVGIETFRDKVTPGTEERVTFSVRDSEGSPLAAAMMVEMYNKAISQITAHRFSINPHPLYTPGVMINSVAGATFGVNVDRNIRYVSGIIPRMPQLNLYNRSFSGSSMRLRGIKLTSAAMAFDDGVNDMNVVQEHEEEIAVEEAAGATDAGPEEITNMSKVSYRAAAAQSATTSEGTDNFSFREEETPLAFFRPMLKTDSDGRMELTYTVPNANTTWILAALAYDNEMLASSATKNIVASKPLMVQPNLPRFLRMGDKAVILANVMNATDTVQDVVTVFEIFDPTNGKTVGSTTSTDRINRGESAIVKAEIEAPMDVVMLGYRVKSSTELYADGEQGIIPILESVQPIIESKPFYIEADTTRFSMQLHPAPANSRITLQFCENPTWYVVTALPGLRANVNRTSTSASAAIFSAAVADGILRSNPEIKTALHRWTTSDRSDSTLVSMLERNQDLKIVMLQASPWMLDARSDSERMDRLALLFDRKAIQSTYDINIEALAKMQCHGGGWAWIPEYKKTSYWATLCILEEMGDLKRLGYLPSDKRLKSMIENAVGYIDRETASQYKKYPNGDYTTYVAVRDMFTDIKQSTAAGRVTAATVQKLIAGWKQLNVTDKAMAAIILNNHSYSATARNIILSLDEYSSSSPSMGLWWPSLDDISYSRYSKIGAASIILDAYRSVTPGSKAIDKIRQWIVIQKEAQDWKDGVVTSQVISSFLTSGSKWTVPARGSIVTIDGQEIEPQAIEKTTGYFRDNITKLASKGGTLEVVKPDFYPSWGAVITQAKMVMGDVKPSACEAVSVEKHYFKAINTPQGVAWVETESYEMGDRLKIDLLIKANRDIDYVAIVDQRSACLEPVEQLPMPIISQGISFYRENRDAVTNIFVDRLPKGVYRLSYEMNVNNAGRFASGVATLQSQYAPALSAHSGGTILNVKP